MTRPLLFDTTALIGAFRNPARLSWLRRASASPRYHLTSVTIAELHAGSRTAQQAHIADQIARLFARDDRLLTPTADEWSAAGRLIARAIARSGAMEPRDHYPDALVAQVAGRIGAAIVTDNINDLRSWIALGHLDATIADS